jgi:hypothetical protein
MTLFRIEPNMPAQAYKTFSIASPGRPATCEETGCDHFLNGWVTAIDESTELGAKQAGYIRQDRSRRCQEQRTQDGVTEFTYGPGQQCFTRHSLPWEGRERFAERGGDFRGNPRGDKYEHNADTWVDSFANHQQKLADRLEQG